MMSLWQMEILMRFEVEIFDEFDTAESGSSDDDDIELETVLERFHFTDEDKESFF